MGLVFEEGGEGGDFKAGQTFMVCPIGPRRLGAMFANQFIRCRIYFPTSRAPGWILLRVRMEWYTSQLESGHAGLHLDDEVESLPTLLYLTIGPLTSPFA
jgi:hypothetical protein